MSPIGGIGFTSYFDNQSVNNLKLALNEGRNRGFTLWQLETTKAIDENSRCILELISLASKHGYSWVCIRNKEKLSIINPSEVNIGNVLIRELDSPLRISLQQFSWDMYMFSLSSFTEWNETKPLVFEISKEIPAVSETLMRSVLHYALSKGFMFLILDCRQLESVVDTCGISRKVSHVVDQVLKDIVRIRYEFEGADPVSSGDRECIYEITGAPYIQTVLWKESNRRYLLYLVNTRPSSGLKQLVLRCGCEAYDIINKVEIRFEGNTIECFFEPYGVKVLRLSSLE